MEELLNDLRRFTSRNEFTNGVVLPRDSYWELQTLAEQYDGLFIEIEEELDDNEVDVLITLDLDTLHVS